MTETQKNKAQIAATEILKSLGYLREVAVPVRTVIDRKAVEIAIKSGKAQINTFTYDHIWLGRTA